ncbi:hypothetical protein TWF718_010134 [Orbilia javanica]|uniref:Uncharacterized protein n=1 Tax=Orbilia javanica TaxID=47235 RepID=A0AAN8MLG5_9PEZI
MSPKPRPINNTDVTPRLEFSLLVIPHDMTFEITAVTVKVLAGGYVGEWVSTTDPARVSTSVLNDDGECTEYRRGPASAIKTNPVTSFDPININQQGFKECRRPVGVLAQRAVGDLEPIYLGKLGCDTYNAWNINAPDKPVIVTLEYVLRRKKPGSTTAKLLKKGKISLSTSKLGPTALSNPGKVYFGESNMDGSNFRETTIEIEDKKLIQRLYISVIPKGKGRKNIDLVMSFMKDSERPSIEKGMSYLLTGIEVVAKVGFEILVPGLGTAVLIGLEVPDIIDLGSDMVRLFGELLNAMEKCNTDEVAKVAAKLWDAIATFGIAVFGVVFDAVTSGVGKAITSSLKKAGPGFIRTVQTEFTKVGKLTVDSVATGISKYDSVEKGKAVAKNLSKFLEPGSSAAETLCSLRYALFGFQTTVQTTLKTTTTSKSTPKSSPKSTPKSSPKSTPKSTLKPAPKSTLKAITAAAPEPPPKPAVETITAAAEDPRSFF